MKRLLSVVGSMSLMACSASLRRPVETTDAATGMEQVTHSDANEINPAVSPDANALAYEVVAAPEAAPSIQVMWLGNHGPAKLGEVEFSSAGKIGMEPAWEPDGSRLIFVTRTSRAQKLVEVLGHGSGHAPFLADVSEIYFAEGWPAISRDGVIASSFGDVQVNEPGSPPNSRLDQALGVSDLVGAGVTVIGRGTEPSWSPDGKRLAFVRVSGGHAHVFVAARDGSGAQQITEGSDDDDEPAWSPSGTRIVFCSGHATDPSVHADFSLHANLFSVNPDGSGLLQLTQGDRFACRPSWGKDGYVYFHVNATDRFHIWRIRPNVTGNL